MASKEPADEVDELLANVLGDLGGEVSSDLSPKRATAARFLRATGGKRALAQKRLVSSLGLEGQASALGSSNGTCMGCTRESGKDAPVLSHPA